MRRRRNVARLLMGALLAAFAVFLVYPVWLTVRGGFETAEGGFTFYHVGQVIADPVLRRGLLNAFAIAGCTTALCLLIALPLAVLAVKFDFPAKTALTALLLVPLILPPFVGAIGLHHLLGRYGTVNTLLVQIGLIDQGIDFIGRGGFWAVVIIEALHLYPIVYLNATAALANLDPALEEAAQSLGAGRWRRFTGIVGPLMRPGLFAGTTIVFIWSLTELGTPLMFNYEQVTPVQIFNGIKAMAVSRQPFALTVVMLVAAAGCYVLGRLVFGGRPAAMSGRAAIQSVPTPLRSWRGLLAAGALSAVIFVAILPHVGVVLTSVSEVGQWYRSLVPRDFTGAHYAAALSHPLAVGSIRNSLFYASAAVVIERHLLDGLAMAPLAIPGLVMAFGYTAMTLRWPLGPGDPLEGVVDVIGAEPNPVPLLIIAYAVRRLPYVVRSTVAGLEQTPVELEQAALNLGAGRLRAVGTILVPLIAANLIAGGLLAFSFAMLEVSDSLILAQRETHFPITKAIYVLFERLGDG
ncbi:MAG: ABC transporter permease, partial [Planctomycetota bacterium]